MKNLILAGICMAVMAEAQVTQQGKGGASSCSSSQSCSYFYQGDTPLVSSCAPSYNLPATVAMPCQWGGFFDASYLYWYAGEGGLDVATQGVLVGGTVLPPNTSSNILYPKFEYSSGFKVGVGGMPGVDDWVLRADYTYVRQKVNTSFAAQSQPNGTGVLFLTSWFVQSSSTQQPLAASSASSQWRLGIDWLDATMSRPHYMGRNWTVTPFGGLRSSWIRQSYHITLNSILNAAGPSQMVSTNRSSGWGIGPRGGVEWHWLAGSQFRFQGAFGASLLYTKYTTLSHSETALTARTDPASYSMSNPTFLQPMAESNLGIGWSGYWSNKARFDLSATYDFNMLWSQNMLRTLNDNFIQGVNPASNNLFLHGVTVNARVDF